MPCTLLLLHIKFMFYFWELSGGLFFFFLIINPPLVDCLGVEPTDMDG